MNDNLKIWEKVDKTDVEHTKFVNQRGGYTSIDATYQALKATEMFGPYGKGWGLKSIDYNYSMLEATKMVMCSAVFFYTLDGKEYSFPIHNAINPMMGAKPDEDFCKKLETNTISKALSRLGFSADIFMGKFDDQEYVAQLKTEQEIEKAENRDAEIQQKRQDTIDYVSRHAESIKSSKNAHETKQIAKAAIRHLEMQKQIPSIKDICERGVASIARESEAKLKELEESK